MKIRQIIKVNIFDKWLETEIKREKKLVHEEQKKTNYKIQKEKEFKDGLSYFLNSILFTPRNEIYSSTSYDDCLRQFIYDVLLKESISIGKQEFEKAVTRLMDATYSYSLEFFFDKGNDEYNGKVYCLISNAENNFTVCAYHVGNGLYIKNMIYLLHEKYKNVTTSRTIFWFAYKYFCGLIIDHVLSAIQNIDWAPDDLGMTYFFDWNSTTPTNINVREFMKGKEPIFEE